MGPASKTSSKTSTRHIGEVDTVVKLKPKMMLKKDMKKEEIESIGGKKERKKEDIN